MKQSKEKYADLLLSDKWMEKRIKVFKRDGYKCQHCGFIHSVCLWFILPFVIVPFLILLYMENKTVQIRRQMLLFAILGFIFGFIIFK